MEFGFKYDHDKGLETEAQYPYKGIDESCQAQGGQYKVSGFKEVPEGSVEQLQMAVAQQPTSVAVEANIWWQFYKGGILAGKCNTTKEEQLDHGVLAVGYGQEGSSSYWIVKNSWSSSWGEEGYIRLPMTKGEDCGITLDASYPLA